MGVQKCSDIIVHHAAAKNQSILNYSLDNFVGLDDDARKGHIEKFNQSIVEKLREIPGIGLSKATKILHTRYPDIVPIIDNPLQELYRREVNTAWTGGDPQIFIDYYQNLATETTNWNNLTEVYRDCEKKGLGLTKVRVFDILWWSFLRAKQLSEEHEKIHLTSIRW